MTHPNSGFSHQTGYWHTSFLPFIQMAVQKNVHKPWFCIIRYLYSLFSTFVPSFVAPLQFLTSTVAFFFLHIFSSYDHSLRKEGWVTFIFVSSSQAALSFVTLFAELYLWGFIIESTLFLQEHKYYDEINSWIFCWYLFLSLWFRLLWRHSVSILQV